MYTLVLNGKESFKELEEKCSHYYYFEPNEKKKQFFLELSMIAKGLADYYYYYDSCSLDVLTVKWHKMAKQYKTEKNKVTKAVLKYVLKKIYFECKRSYLKIDITIPFDRTKD